MDPLVALACFACCNEAVRVKSLDRWRGLATSHVHCLRDGDGRRSSRSRRHRELVRLAGILICEKLLLKLRISGHPLAINALPHQRVSRRLACGLASGQGYRRCPCKNRLPHGPLPMYLLQGTLSLWPAYTFWVGHSGSRWEARIAPLCRVGRLNGKYRLRAID